MVPDWRLSRTDWSVIAAAVGCWLPFIFFGYGSDNDSYVILDAGRELLDFGRYRPSRPPDIRCSKRAWPS